MNTEATARVIIDSLLEDSDWIINPNKGEINVTLETSTNAGRLDYLMLDTSGFPLCVLEAKKGSPLDGKEQARRYAKDQNCRFIILSNGESHYLWDLKIGNPTPINVIPKQEELELTQDGYNPEVESLYEEEINEDFIVLTQLPDYKKDPTYINENTRNEFISKNKLRFLRPYQLNALKAIQQSAKNGNDRFLLEMATGTGKTLTSCAIIKMFLRSSNVKRVLFLVDRLELESQAYKQFTDVLKDDYITSIWKETKSDWRKAKIVISTIQSLKSNNRYKKEFKKDDFDLVISDESHRSIGGQSRKVFEYFIGFKLGLTATPKDYLKSVDKTNLGSKDPRELERRQLLDTYSIFGCESGNPTFRYSLLDGVKDGYLINPKVFDARTKITTQLLSDQGYLFTTSNDEGDDVDEIFTQRDFEKKFFSEKTNEIFCKTFLENAKKDPYTGEIGKSLIFCVSQKHASKITQILNVIATKQFPGVYQSDFAIQVTSGVQNSQQMTVDFSNNKLSGTSKINDYYRTSKTRVCVTVGMMTTGYDCTDLVNLCMMRPIFSPSDFVQMKGRGTRKDDFKNYWISDDEIPEIKNSVKDLFYLFDFFGNCEYFEEKFNYDEALILPTTSDRVPSSDEPVDIDYAENFNLDPIKTMQEINIDENGMKIDRMYFDEFKETINEDETLKDMVNKEDYESAEKYLRDNIFDKPKNYFNLDKLKLSLKLDRKPTIKELLLNIFGIEDKIKTRIELIEDEFDKFDEKYQIDENTFNDIKSFFETFLTDEEIRQIIESKEFARLNTHPSGDVFKKVPKEFKTIIPEYINKSVDISRFSN
jgi:type I restriction enzyme, R subunit